MAEPYQRTNNGGALCGGRADPWAAETDRPQHATYTSESFLPPPRGPAPNRRPSRYGTSQSTPAASSGSRYARSAAASGSSARPRSQRCRRTDRMCCAATARCSRCPATVSWARLWTGSASCAAPRELDDIRALGLGKELLLKVNPDIVVDVEVTAGSLNTERVPHLGKVRVTAGGPSCSTSRRSTMH